VQDLYIVTNMIGCICVKCDS